MRLKCLSVGKREQPQDRGLLATAGDGIEPGGESRRQLIQAPSQRVMLQHPRPEQLRSRLEGTGFARQFDRLTITRLLDPPGNGVKPAKIVVVDRPR